MLTDTNASLIQNTLLQPPDEDEPAAGPFSPTPSHAESFTTAYTSPSDPADTLAIPPSFPLQGLRKSMSVDSFVHFGRDGDHTTTPQGKASPIFDVLNNLASGRNRYLLGPHRRFGLDSADERDGSLDSDVERSDPVERHRHPSLNNPSRPHIRGGELPLPSRTPHSTSTSSMSSMSSTSASSSKTLEDIPRQPIFSLQPLTGRPVPTVSQSRARSGSLGTYMNAGRHRPVERRTAAPYLLKERQEGDGPRTLVMVGTAGCGKSTAIQCGLQGYTLVPAQPIHWGASMKYSRQDWQVQTKESKFPLQIIEIDVSTEPLGPTDLTSSSDWLDSISDIDGVIICYDASDKRSFRPVDGLLRRLHSAAKVPYIVLACKIDLKIKVDPHEASESCDKYDTGLVEGTNSDDKGLRGLRQVFTWILKSAERHKRQKGQPFRNPASPKVLRTSPSRAATPTASFSRRNNQDGLNISPTTLSPNHPIFPTPPTRTRSTGDLLRPPEALKIVVDTNLPSTGSGPHIHQMPDQENMRHPNLVKDEVDASARKDSKDRESRPGQYATLNDLLDKLLFLAVSGDDSSYITHFLLTYRRFAVPRNIILAMQKRIRELDEQSSGDPMFACFAQMRICHLLEVWIRDYPYDFAVPGTASALSALITSIISKTYLLHYGSEFLPFLEVLPTLVDHDAAWALKVDTLDESDDTDSLLEVDCLLPLEDDSVSPSPTHEQPTSLLPGTTRERKPSFPLQSMLANGTKAITGTPEMDNTSTEKQQIKDLLKLSQEIQSLEPEDIAQEITRIEVKLFLDIKPRHWLSYTFVSKKDEGEPISAFNALSNHLADWVVSLILCHKTPRARVKQIEKLVEIAQRLRALNNYSALRAFVAGINNATFSGDETMEQFKAKCPDQAKNLKSWDVLLQHIRSHRAYRLALRNSKGACIPALEVHMSDLIKAHEGNGDIHSSDPDKIHWGKFNMMGKFISSTAQCQAQCRTASDYTFTERSHIKDLLLSHSVMNDQMQKSRIAPIDSEVDDYRPIPGTGPSRDAALLRKLIFW